MMVLRMLKVVLNYESKLWLSKLSEVEIKLHRNIGGEIQRIEIMTKINL